VIDDLAYAVRDQINAETFSLPFVAEFTDTPKRDPDQLTNLKVLVAPLHIVMAPVRKGVAATMRFRAIEQYSYLLAVVVAQKGPPNVSSGVDPILAFSAARRALMQEMGAFFNSRLNRSPANYSNARLTIAEFSTLYDVVELRDKRTFIGGLTLTFEEHKRP